ncbi:glycosyltransferase family 2 protein [Sphingobacterium sp. BS-2]|uniref:glycosyltransferase family 2 protein n=1 Tax=Sphingobacterium sp. BS-2 TaxID=3377129 RepID=UPI0038FC99E6
MDLSKNNKILSVIIPSYNPGAYIYDCLNSILEQNILQTSIEIIVVLNGTKEPYYSNLVNFSKSYSHIRILYNPVKGVSRARNMGLEFSSGTHVLFVDDDDFISEGYLKEVIKQVKKNPNAVVFTNFLKFYKNGDIGNDYLTNTYNQLINDNKLSINKCRKLLSSSCGKAIPLNVINNIRFDNSIKISEDALFMFEISKNYKSLILCGTSIAYYRRVRDSSASRKRSSLMEKVKVYSISSISFTRIYLSSPLKYNLMFYLSRLLAASKFFLLTLKK